jgi:hypothetical protein
MRTLLVLPLVGLLVVACASGSHDRSRPSTNLVGSWGWSKDGPSCAETPHKITFSPDKKIMYLAMREDPASSGGQAVKTVTYRVLEFSTERLRLAMEGERRRTAEGSLVEWDVVGLSPDSYCWHRSDWTPRACTSTIVRCDP